MQGVPLDSVKDVNAARYEELMGINHLIQSFNLFTMSKNVGIKYGPTDLDIEQVVIFNSMEEEVRKHSERKNGR